MQALLAFGTGSRVRCSTKPGGALGPHQWRSYGNTLAESTGSPSMTSATRNST